MKIVMTLLVRDEIDIVADMLDAHFALGVDFVVATDNLSVDGTTDVLRHYEQQGRLHLIEEREDTYDQPRWVSRMARLAATDFGADWVINADADEFWWPTNGDLRTTLGSVPDGVDVVVAQRFNFVARGEPSGTPPAAPWHDRLRWRYTMSVNHEGVALPPKVCHRAHPEAQVFMGNHWVEHPTRGELDDGRLVVLHFPMRSYVQFATKIIKGGEALERNDDLPDSLGVVWRRLLDVHRQGRFEDEWRSWAVDDAELADGLAAGTMIEDRRVADLVQRLRSAG
ncbi:MAG: glycosyltransferase family 2 protein [Acidimicrobiia bacterium]|nr:glycosyltransferase family 2 protein [Acidimicrobiia bacterium]